MDAEQIRERIAEFAALRPDAGDDSVAQVEAALFIEEVFGLTLSDEDMTRERLGTHRDIEALVLHRMGVTV